MSVSERHPVQQSSILITDKQQPDHRVAIPLPNGYMRAALKAIEDIAGQQALHVMLRYAGLENAIATLPPDNLNFDAGYAFRDYSDLNHAIVSFYGRAGKGHAVRIGRRSARWMIENHPLFGFAGMVFANMPTTQAIRMSMNNAANGFRKLYKQVHFDIHIDILENDDHFLWQSPDCPCCVGKSTDTPICWIWEAGLLEGGSFVTGGKRLDVEQTQCIAMGASVCEWRISKKPSRTITHL
jgi:predicted hydrocarbon binding protein